MTKATELLRFMKKIGASTPGGCLLWDAQINEKGYGFFRMNGSTGRKVKAHRYIYELVYGPIPDGLTIDHVCRTRNCVNPQHMDAVSAEENVRRGWEFRGITKDKCLRGHHRTPENTRRPRGKGKECLICARGKHLGVPVEPHMKVKRVS